MIKPIDRSRPGETRDGATSPVFRSLCLVMAAVIALQLLYLGAQPFAAGLIRPPWDKLAHLAVFSVLAALLWLGTAGSMLLAVIVAIVAFGAVDEIRQLDLPGRSADLLDFLVDICAALGTILLMLRAQQRALCRPPKSTGRATSPNQ